MSVKLQDKCGRGHPFEGDNVGRQPNGQRYCRACKNLSKARARKRAKRLAVAQNDREFRWPSEPLRFAGWGARV